MFAVVKAGGHQLRVREGDVVTVDKLAGEVGQDVTFDQVLAIDSEFGAPTLGGAAVTARIKEQIREPKIIIFKYKRRKNYKRKRGHRQERSVVEITKIKRN